MDPAQIPLLHDLIRRQSRSLLQYAREAYPWSKARDQAVSDAVQAIAEEQADALASLGRWLAKQRVPVSSLGAYPMHFTTMNFIAVHALLPRIIADERQQIAAVEQTYLALPDGEARGTVQALLDLKKNHLQQLNELQAVTSPPAIAS
jgi:hypothetical protein